MFFDKYKTVLDSKILFLILSMFLIFPSVLFNSWNLFENERFKGFEFNSESLVIGHLMRVSIALFSEILVIFGKNLYWMTFLLFLPLVVNLYFHQLEDKKKEFHSFYYLFIIGFLMFVKSACGYEYISTVMVTTIIPTVYFSIKNLWDTKKTFFRVCQTAVACLTGFTLAIFFHLFQLSIAYGGLTQGVEIVWNRVAERTHFYQVGTVGLDKLSLEQLNIFSVLDAYLTQRAFTLPFTISITYMHLLTCFFVICLLGNIYLYFFKNLDRKFVGLSACTALSAAGTCSWYILAKGHSLNHTHLNTILWHTPLTFFGVSSVIYFLMLMLKMPKRHLVKRHYAR